MLLTPRTVRTLIIIALLYGDTFDKRCFQIAAEQGANKSNTSRAIEHLAMVSWRTYEATSAWYHRNNYQIIRILFEPAGAPAVWKNSTLQFHMKDACHKKMPCCFDRNLLR